MKNTQDWYLTNWFVHMPGPQVLERVVGLLSPTNPRMTVEGQVFRFTPVPIPYFCVGYFPTHEM
jgi:hypothetical protein